MGVVGRRFRRFCNLLHQILQLSVIRVAFDVKRGSPTLFPDRSIYCIEVKYEVWYCEFVYAVSASSTSGLRVRASRASFNCRFLQSLAQDITSLDGYGRFGVIRRSLTLFPVFFPKPEAVSNGQAVPDRTIYRIKVE